MRKDWLFVSIATAALACGSLQAGNITYSVNGTAGTGTFSGFITTDGTIGTLGTSNILDWNVLLTDGAAFDLQGPLSGDNSGPLVGGADLTATATQLLFNFSATDTGFFLLESPAPGDDGEYICYDDTAVVCGNPAFSASVSIGTTDPLTNSVATELSGNQVIAQVEAEGVPEPGSLMLVACGLLGVAALGRRRFFA
jgi:hypothetical protein